MSRSLSTTKWLEHVDRKLPTRDLVCYISALMRIVVRPAKATIQLSCTASCFRRLSPFLNLRHELPERGIYFFSRLSV